MKEEFYYYLSLACAKDYIGYKALEIIFKPNFNKKIRKIEKQYIKYLKYNIRNQKIKINMKIINLRFLKYLLKIPFSFENMRSMIFTIGISGVLYLPINIISNSLNNSPLIVENKTEYYHYTITYEIYDNMMRKKPFIVELDTQAPSAPTGFRATNTR